MAALGGVRSTLANQSYITRHGRTASRILSSVRGEKSPETVEAAYWLDILLTVTPRVKLYNSSPFAS